jgi:hypothetical protein
MQNGPTDREIMHFKYIFFAFWLGISVYGDFEVIFLQEGVGIKAREGLQSNRNTKIRREPYSHVSPNLYITDFTGYTDYFLKFTGF